MSNELWYVATPYSKYPRGITAAFCDAAEAAANLMRKGFDVYSPIAHTHPLATQGNIDPLDHKIWLSLDQHIMNAAYGMIVLMMPSWEISYGIKHEIEYFTKAGKPIRYFSWPELQEKIP